MTEQKTLEATLEQVAAVLEAATDVVATIDAAGDLAATERKRFAGTLRRIADWLDPMDANPPPTIH